MSGFEFEFELRLQVHLLISLQMSFYHFKSFYKD